MSEYKLVTGRNGVRYMKDNRFVKKESLPPEVWTQLKVNEISTEEMLNPKVDRSCIFCGEQSKLSRLLNAQTIYLCDNHYYSETIGKVAQRVRERNEENSNQSS